MPRKNQNLRRRTGCFQCKEKHFRCTEEKPRCSRCQRLGIECSRGLRLIFREDAAQRGIRFGREGVWTSNPKSKARRLDQGACFQAIPLDSYVNRWMFLNATVGDFSGGSSSAVENSTMPISLTPSIPPSFHHPLDAFPDTESYLLDYFIQGISPSCSLTPAHNPYVSLVIPLCFISPTLRYALLAVAANQLCLLGNSEFLQDACQYRHKALHGLRHELSHGIHDDGTVAAVLMLCFQDISDGCSPSWTTHLRGGMQLTGHLSQPNSAALWKFFRMYFVAHDVMSRTASNDGQGDEGAQLWSEEDDLEEIDVVMGCSRGLMTLINRITTLASAISKISEARALTSDEIKGYALVTADIRTALLALKQTLPQHALQRTDLERIARIKKLAALLYLHERLGPVEQSRDLPNQHLPMFNIELPVVENLGGLWWHKAQGRSSRVKKHRACGRPSSEEAPAGLESHPESETRAGGGTHIHAQSKNEIVSSMIRLIATLPDMATLLWPLFILGNVGLENEEHRRFVLDRLANIYKSRNLGHIRRTMEAVKQIFVSRDLRSPAGRIWEHESYRDISLA